MNLDSLVRFCSDALIWIAEPAVRAIVIAGIVAGALWIFRARNTVVQITAWMMVLCAALALPALAWLLPSILLPLPAKAVRTQRSEIIRTVRAYPPVKFAATIPISRPAPIHAVTQLTPTPELASARWPLFAFAIYLGGVVFFAARLCIGLILTRRMRLSATPVDDPVSRHCVEHYARVMQIRRLPELLESRAVNVPLTMGLLQHAIVIPDNWRTWEDGKLSAVIAHELSHAQRRDPLTRIVAAAYRSIFWFSPLSWWLEYHLAELGEQASDQAAISAGTEPTYYAEVLMSFFRTMHNGQGRMNWQGARMAAGSRAVERIERVLALKRFTTSRFRKSHLFLLSAAVLVVVCVVAAARPRFVMAAQLPTSVAQISPAALPSAPAVPSTPASPSAADLPAVANVPPPSKAIPQLATTIQGISATPATPAVPSVLLGEVPIQPVLASDDGTIIYRNTSLSGEMDFAIVNGQSISMNGSEDDRREVESLRKTVPGDFIWFIHSGTSYIIRDATTVQAAKQFYAPMDGLGKQMEELGKQQDALGKQMDFLGKQMEAIRINVPSDLVQRVKEVEAKLNALGGSADMDQLGKLQGELGDLQGKLGDLQGKAGDFQGELGQKQGAIGEKQGELGQRQADLGKEQTQVAEAAAAQMQDVINKALASGTAKRVK